MKELISAFTGATALIRTPYRKPLMNCVLLDADDVGIMVTKPKFDHRNAEAFYNCQFPTAIPYRSILEINFPGEPEEVGEPREP